MAIVRISGEHAIAALERLAGPAPLPRRATLRDLRGADGGLLDRALVLLFRAPASYTGEDVVELHCHGGRAVVSAVLDTLARVEGFVPAEPGEFTRRAFVNGRMDLTEIEALGDLLAAETETQRRFAMAGVSGAVRRVAEGWRAALVEALAMIEATIDWADEEVPEDVGPEVSTALAATARSMRAELERSAGIERLREGFEVALVGAPNAGKSSLLNRIAGRSAAIVTAEPGTTRDVIEVRLDLEGLPVHLLDTAGVRDAAGRVEAIGVEQAVERARDADLRVLLEAPDAPLPQQVRRLKRDGDLLVAAKSDLGALSGLAVSARTGEGVGDLLSAIAGALEPRCARDAVLGRARQRHAVAAAVEGVERALSVGAPELVAEEVREALRRLEGLTGRTEVDHVLDEVFARFCLGK